MPKLISDSNVDAFAQMVNQQFYCPETKRTYQIVADDQIDFSPTLWIGSREDGFSAPGIKCPDCGGKIYLSKTGKLQHGH